MLKEELKAINKCFFYRQPDYMIDVYLEQSSSLSVKTPLIKALIKKIEVNQSKKTRIKEFLEFLSKSESDSLDTNIEN